MGENFSFEKPKVEPSLKEQKELPTGEARKVAESVSSRWKEQMVLLSQVRNRVLDINEEVNLPFRLEKGKQSPLGLFVEAIFDEEPTKIPPKKKSAEYWPEHERAVILGRALFNDKDGRIWRDIDLKGMGHVRHSSYSDQGLKIQPLGLGGFSPGLAPEAGLLHRDTAFVDYDLSEQFLKAGIRTNRVLAIIQLDELIDNGKKISLREARKRGIIKGDFHPVVELRAFVTKARIADITGMDHPRADYGEDWSKVLLMDARKLVTQELGKKETMTNEEYLEWFAKILGQNVALMHRNGWSHNYLSVHNITLDCRIIDLDGVESLPDNKGGGGQRQAEYERETAFQALLRLSNSINEGHGTNNETCYRDLFSKSYEEVFPSKEENSEAVKVSRETKKMI